MLVLEAFRRATDFKGRSSREEFLSFFGAVVIVLLIINVLAGNRYMAVLPAIVIGLAICAVPALSLVVRRLHDLNREPRPLWTLLALSGINSVLQSLQASLRFTFVGPILQALVVASALGILATVGFVIYLCCRPGDEGANDFGPPPGKVEVDRAGLSHAASAVTMTPVEADSGQGDPLVQIERLSKLRDAGALTDEEFAEQKAALLKRL